MCKDKTFPFITKFELPLCRSNIELKCTLIDYFTLKIIPSSMCTLVFSFSSVNSIHLCEHHKNYQKKILIIDNGNIMLFNVWFGKLLNFNILIVFFYSGSCKIHCWDTPCALLNKFVKCCGFRSEKMLICVQSVKRKYVEWRMANVNVFRICC